MKKLRFAVVFLCLLLPNGMLCAADESDTIKEIKAAEFTAKYNAVQETSLYVAFAFLKKYGRQLELEATLGGCGHNEYGKSFILTQKDKFDFVLKNVKFQATKKQYPDRDFTFDVLGQFNKFLKGYQLGFARGSKSLIVGDDNFCNEILEEAKQFLTEKEKKPS